MRQVYIAKITAGLLVGLACLMSVNPLLAQEEDDSTLDLIVGFVTDPIPDMRVLGLQSVRDEVPGEAATKRFAALLPDVSSDIRAELIAALGDRGDAVARDAVLACMTDETPEVQLAAMRALGALGSAEDVPVLVAEVALDDPAHVAAARDGLVRLRGDGVDRAIADCLADATEEVSVRLLEMLAARDAVEVVATVVDCAEDDRAAIRLAALETLRTLAGEDQAADLVKALKAAKDEPERRKAQLALLTVCRSGSETCVDAILAGLDGPEPAAQIALMQALARCGGTKALDEIVKRLDDSAESISDEAMRLLSIWPDAAAVETLRAIAEKKASLREQVLAIRGLVNLGSLAANSTAEGDNPEDDNPEDDSLAVESPESDDSLDGVALLIETMALADRTEEKRLVVGALGNASTIEALDAVVPFLDDEKSGLIAEAVLATVAIAERIMEGGGEKASVTTALNKVIKVTENQGARQRARVIIDAP